MYALIENGEITRINVTLPITIGNTSIGKGATGLEAFGLYPIVGSEPAYDPETQRMAGPQYVFDGAQVNRVYTVEAIPVEEKAEALKSSIVAATEQRLDAFARTRGYDDIKSASDYAGCSVPQFSIEGQYCKDKRAETWAKCYEILAEVQAGTRPVPDGYDDIEPDLPALVWPT